MINNKIYTDISYNEYKKGWCQLSSSKLQLVQGVLTEGGWWWVNAFGQKALSNHSVS